MLTVKTPPSFTDYAESNQLDDNTFPYSDKGPHLRRRAKKMTNWMIQAVVWMVVFRLARRGLRWFMLNRAVDTPLGTSGLTTGNLYTGAYRVLNALITVATVAVGVCAVLMVIAWLVYLRNVVKRQRAFERNVIRNDSNALKLKAKLLKKHNISSQLSRFKREEAQKRTSASKSGGSYYRSQADENKLGVLKAVSNLEVHINTRQGLSGPDDDVITTTRIEVRLPFDDEQSEQTKTAVKKYGLSANSITAVDKALDATQFATDPTITSDNQYAVFSSKSVATDRYARPDDTAAAAVAEDEYMPSMDLNTFTDRTDEIAAAQKRAVKFMEQAGKTIHTTLINNDISAKLAESSPGSSSAMFRFELAESAKATNIGSVTDALNQTFSTQTCTAAIQGNAIVATVPLPDEAKVPIDVKQMITEVFF